MGGFGNQMANGCVAYAEFNLQETSKCQINTPHPVPLHPYPALRRAPRGTNTPARAFMSNRLLNGVQVQAGASAPAFSSPLSSSLWPFWPTRSLQDVMASPSSRLPRRTSASKTTTPRQQTRPRPPRMQPPRLTLPLRLTRQHQTPLRPTLVQPIRSHQRPMPHQRLMQHPWPLPTPKAAVPHTFDTAYGGHLRVPAFFLPACVCSGDRTC